MNLDFSDQLHVVGFLALLSLLPFLVIVLTSFTRLTIIFGFLRQALGTQQVPSAQIVTGLSLILTFFIMQPVIKDVQEQAVSPYLTHKFQDDPEVKSGAKTEKEVFAERAWPPLRTFLLNHTRESDLLLFLDIAHVEPPQTDAASAIPWYCILPGFVLSELRIAFMMGFLLFIPFLVIDMVVASILMSMGIMMLSPVLVSLPFKLLLFIMVDGWALLVEQVVKGYHP
jgi:flagellar biosynthesis protein FliP